MSSPLFALVEIIQTTAGCLRSRLGFSIKSDVSRKHLVASLQTTFLCFSLTTRNVCVFTSFAICCWRSRWWWWSLFSLGFCWPWNFALVVAFVWPVGSRVIHTKNRKPEKWHVAWDINGFVRRYEYHTCALAGSQWFLPPINRILTGIDCSRQQKNGVHQARGMARENKLANL